MSYQSCGRIGVLPVTLFSRYTWIFSLIRTSQLRCASWSEINYNTCGTYFQGITDTLYHFGRPFLLLIFLPLHRFFYPPTIDFTHPNDRWTGGSLHKAVDRFTILKSPQRHWSKYPLWICMNDLCYIPSCWKPSRKPELTGVWSSVTHFEDSD